MSAVQLIRYHRVEDACPAGFRVIVGVEENVGKEGEGIMGNYGKGEAVRRVRFSDGTYQGRKKTD